MSLVIPNSLERSVCFLHLTQAFMYSLSGSKGATYVQERSSAMNTDASQEACLDLISTWMHTCSTSHAICASMTTQESITMPTRVIDVGSGPNPKLVFTNGKSAGRYVALSYCWGPPDPDTLKLTSKTMSSLTQGNADATRFTKTHQEAFHLVRLMDIQYIWIDALCIFQDDPKDWAAESRKLGDIYWGAYLTLVAGSSADARSGFLQNRTSKVQPCPIPFDSSQYSGEPFLYATPFPSTDEGPTATRGWCYQEAMLSKRCVVIGVEQMSFRCPSGTTFEFKLRNNQTQLQQAIVPPSATPIFRPDMQLLGKSVEDGRRILLQHWYMILRDFTGRHFTNPDDLFASMGSLAHLVAKHFALDVRNRYLAGIWEADIIRGLLWRARYQENRPARLTRPELKGGLKRAPSWSWAAVEGVVDHIDFEPHGGIREGTTSTAGNWVPQGVWMKNSVFSVKPGFIRVHPAAEIAGTAERSWSNDISCGPHALHMPACELQMMGHLTRGIVSDRQVNIRKWEPRHDWRPLSQRGSMKLYDGFRPRFEDALSIYAHGIYLLGGGDDDEEKDGKAFAIGVFDVEEEVCEDVWCLQMTEVEGLMLQLVRDEEKGKESTDSSHLKFRRLGLFWLENSSWYDGVEKVRVCLV